MVVVVVLAPNQMESPLVVPSPTLVDSVDSYLRWSFFRPPLLCGLFGDCGALLRAEGSGPSRATLEATETAQGDGCGVLGLHLWLLVLLGLAGGLQHDLVGQLVWITGALL